MTGIVRNVTVCCVAVPKMEAPAPVPPTMAGATKAVLITRRRRSAVRATLVACGLIRFANNSKENTMNRSMALGLAMVAGSAFVATAINGLHAQNKAPGAYADLDLRTINSPDVFKKLPSKMGDFDGHTA